TSESVVKVYAADRSVQVVDLGLDVKIFPAELQQMVSVLEAQCSAWIPGARGLKLRRRCVAADRIKSLDVDLRQAAENPRIIRHIFQSNLGWRVNPCVGWRGEIVSARPAKPEIAHQARRKRSRQSDCDALRIVFISTERIIE